MNRNENNAIADDIVTQMSANDRAAFTVDGWRDGISAMLTDEWASADLNEVLNAIADLIARDLAISPLAPREVEDLRIANVFLMDWVCDGWGRLPAHIAEINNATGPLSNAQKRAVIAFYHHNARGDFS